MNDLILGQILFLFLKYDMVKEGNVGLLQLTKILNIPIQQSFEP